MMCYSAMTQANSEKEIPNSPNRSGTYDLPITSSVALPLSYRRHVGASFSLNEMPNLPWQKVIERRQFFRQVPKDSAGKTVDIGLLVE